MIDRLRRNAIAFNAEERMNGFVVASVPNRSWPDYRSRLRKCLQAANIGNVAIRFVYEPTAAAVACLHEMGAFDDPVRFAGPILVVDWGGGTVDVSLIELRGNGSLFDLNTGGREDGIGGTSMDEYLVRLANSESPELNRAVQQLTRGQIVTLHAAVERFKIQGVGRLDIGLDVSSQEIILPQGDGVLTLTETHLRECVDHFCSKVQDLAIKVVSEAGVSPEDISGKIFVGGPFNSQFVRDNKAFFTWRNAQPYVYRKGPQFATAAGCAILAERNFEMKLACDIGVVEADGEFFSVAKAGEGVPSEGSVRLMQNQQFDVRDLGCTEAVFEFARRPGRDQQNSDPVPMGRVQVPLCHAPLPDGSLAPFSPRIEESYLDVNLNFGVKVVGSVANFGDPNEPDPMMERKFDCLPMELRINQP
jgi:hypothetical protein